MLRDFTKETFDIVIQAGQSNAEGCGLGPVEHPYEPDDRVFYLNSDFTITQACERVVGNYIQTNFSLAFARKYLQKCRLPQGRKLLILRCAVGGTGFLDNRWGMTDDLYLRMMDMIRTALALNSKNRLVAFLWHQGETDAIFQATYEQHFHHLKALLNSVRNTFHAEQLPFVAGDFVQHWKQDNLAICIPVVAAIRDLCADLPCCGFVETEGLLSNTQEPYWKPEAIDDSIHFSRKALYGLGERYYDCFAEIGARNR